MPASQEFKCYNSDGADIEVNVISDTGKYSTAKLRKAIKQEIEYVGDPTKITIYKWDATDKRKVGEPIVHCEDLVTNCGAAFAYELPRLQTLHPEVNQLGSSSDQSEIHSYDQQFYVRGLESDSTNALFWYELAVRTPLNNTVSVKEEEYTKRECYAKSFDLQPNGESEDDDTTVADVIPTQDEEKITNTKLPLSEVTNPQFLKFSFQVADGVWVVDHFLNSFSKLVSGVTTRQHAATKLLQVERNLVDSCRLRLLFFDAEESYELRFQSPEDRERFYETAQAIRPSIRVYAPSLSEGSLAEGTATSGTTTINGIDRDSVLMKWRDAAESTLAPRELTGQCKINACSRLTEPLTVWTGTFNMTGHSPRNLDVLRQWMPKDKYDIYAVAVQEASYRKEDSEWFEFVQAYLGRGYLCLASMNLWDTLLIVLCRKKLLLKITNVEGSTKATRHKSVCGTKGGIGISLCYLETSLCFVTCHLAERDAMRKTNLEEIVDCLQLGIPETDICSQFHHVFFFGDFNSRLGCDVATAERVVQAGDSSKLLEFDQFNQQRATEGICHGFQEPPIFFGPTFHPRAEQSSFSDRVITRSMNNTWIKCTGYKSHPTHQPSTSAWHHPVSATFGIHCVRPTMACFMTSQSPIIAFVFKEIKFVESSGPIIQKPAIMIRSSFSNAGQQIETKTTKTATPSWDSADLPNIIAVTQVQEYLETCHFVFIIRDAAEGNPSKMHRGSSHVTLYQRVIDAQDVEQEFEADVMFHSRRIGKLTGKFHWEPELES